MNTTRSVIIEWKLRSLTATMPDNRVYVWVLTSNNEYYLSQKPVEEKETDLAGINQILELHKRQPITVQAFEFDKIAFRMERP